MNKIKFRVTQNGKALAKSKYKWDEKTRTFSTKEYNLVLDFKDISDCTFDTGSDCTFDTGSDCTFKTGSDCTFDTGSDCTFDTGSDCTFNTGSDCTFKTRWDCTFDTGTDCTFDTGSDCTFKTGSGCTFKTGSDCTFKTRWGCTFDTGSGCTFDTGSDCVVVRRDIFEIIQTKIKETLKLCPFNIKGYLTKKENETNFCMNIDGKRVPHIIADGILSRVVKKHTNKGITVYKVVNYGEDKETYIVSDGENYSHGNTLKSAKDDLKFKISDRDTSMYNDYTLDTELLLSDAIKMYRKITGACEQGTRYFVENNKLPKKATVREIIKFTEGQYNNQKLKEFFKK